MGISDRGRQSIGNQGISHKRLLIFFNLVTLTHPYSTSNPSRIIIDRLIRNPSMDKTFNFFKSKTKK